MPADKTRGRYDDLAWLAQRFGASSGDCAGMLRELKQSLEPLQGGDWIGQGASAFYAEMGGQVLPSLQRLVKALAAAEKAIRAISAEFKRAELEAAALLKDTAEPAKRSGGFFSGLWSGIKDAAGAVWGGVKQVGGFVEGVALGAWDTVTGLWQLVTHPVQTAQGLWYGITHPSELWDALKKPYVDDWQSGNYGRAIGRGAFEVISLFAGGAGAAGKGGKMASIADKAADAARLADKAADIARVGDKASDIARIGDKASDVARVADEAAEAGRVFGGRGSIPLDNVTEFGSHKGVVSGRPFFPDEIGLPIESRSIRRVTVSQHCLDDVVKHIARFGDDPVNSAAVQRLRDIADGKIKATDYDLNFYTHELREFERYKALGYETGVPVDPAAQHRLWNNTHTATLEEYGLRDADVYHPDVLRAAGDP